MIRRSYRMALAAFAALSLLAAPAAGSSSETLLYTFQAGTDGSVPPGGLVRGPGGALFGTTENTGGKTSEGTVFEAAPPSKPGGAWKETVLHSFSNYFEGQYPFAGLVADRAGNLYGTTWLGGNGSCDVETCGVIFELSPPRTPGGAWEYAVLHNFSGPDGGGSTTSLTIDSAGNLYGTTSIGGSGACSGGCGIVFELSHAGKAWNETVLYNFPAVGHGEDTYGGTSAPVALDASGNLYGTAFVPGAGYGGGVFELARPKHAGDPWQHRDLHVFRTLTGGVTPAGGVSFDAAGNLYGTTRFGGRILSDCGGNSCGTIFRLEPTRSGPWTHTILHSFTGMGDGGFPQDTLTVNAAGTTIFGTTQESGSGTGCGCGTLFKLQNSGRNRYELGVLHTFRGDADGYVPAGGVIFADGLLYGTTKFGGSKTCGSSLGCGTIFAETP